MLETLDKKKLLDVVHELFEESVSADSEWQMDAREAFEFRDNDQP